MGEKRLSLRPLGKGDEVTGGGEDKDQLKLSSQDEEHLNHMHSGFHLISLRYLQHASSARVWKGVQQSTRTSYQSPL